jgi:hypothetical protein
MSWAPYHRGGRMPRKWKKAGVLTRHQPTVPTAGLAGIELLLGVARQLAPPIRAVGQLLGLGPTPPNGVRHLL